MGQKGSKQSLQSRFKPADFFFGESGAFGTPAKATCIHLCTTSSTTGSAPAAEERLLAVGGEDGSVMVYGHEGVHTHLFETPPPQQSASDDEDSASKAPPPRSAALYLHSLPRGQLISVHAAYIKMWSLEGMCEIFTLHFAEVPPASKSTRTPYVVTCAAIANEYDRRYCWLGTSQGEVLLFDCVKKRMSAYHIPLLPEVEQHCVESGGGGGARVPFAITAIAQQPSDSSQLLLGYACDLVLTYHISTSKLHRAYKRSGCGGVTSLCWETGGLDAARAAEHFVVGHRDGSIAVWKRKYHHSPTAVCFLSDKPGARHPVSSVRWSARTFGFFVCGGQLVNSTSTPATAAPATAEGASASAATPSPSGELGAGGVVFISGQKFENRKLCAPGDLSSTGAGSSSSASSDGSPAVVGTKDFIQIYMTRPAPANAAALPSTPGASASSSLAKPPPATPLFICLDHAGQIRLHFPTVNPPVPALPPTHMQESPFDSVSLQSATVEDAPLLKSILQDLRAMTPAFRPWLSLIRTSLSQQHLWPLTGGMSSHQMALYEAAEEMLFRKMNLDGSTSKEGLAQAGEGEEDKTLPALLLTIHSTPEVAIRLHDATSPYTIDLLAVLSLSRVLPAGATVSTALFCMQRRELLVGTSTGEVLLYRLQKAKPAVASPPAEPKPAAVATAASPRAAAKPTEAPSAGPMDPMPASSAPSTDAAVPPPANTAPVPSSPTAAAASTAAPLLPAAAPAPSTPEFSFDLIHRLSFSSRAIRLVLYSPEVSKYAIIDSGDTFTFFRPDTGATLAQTIPGAATITAAHFSAEPLLKPKSGAPLTSLFLYLCASDGSIHCYSSLHEAPLGSIASISGDEARVEVVGFLQTVSFRSGASAGMDGASAAPSSSGSSSQPDSQLDRYLLCCTSQNVKLICSGAKGVESLLSLRTAEPIRLAFLVCSPHPIEQRDVVASKGSAANLSEMEKSSAPAVTAAPARELCLAIVDTQSVLTVYSVQLKILFSSPLCNLSPSRLSPQTFSMSSDGRVAFLPSATFLVEAQLFPAKCYSCTAPPARLLRPVETSIDSIEAAAVAANAPPASGGGGWFSALIPTVSHATLFDTQMYKPPEEVEHALAPFKSSAGSDDSVASSAPDRTSTGSSTSSSRLAASSSSASSDSSSSSSVDPKIRSAQKEISSAKSQMQMNNQIAANNLRKTEEIQDKAEMMASHAGDFLAAARKLKQQQKDSWW